MRLRSLALVSCLAPLAPSQPLAAQTAGGTGGVTTHLSATGAGALAAAHSVAPSVSGDGRWVVFHSFAPLLPGDVNGYSDVYAHDRQTGVLTGVSVAPGGGFGDAPSYHADVSQDGRYVVYESGASNLVPLDGNGFTDVYLMDLQTGVNVRVSNQAGSAAAASGGSDQASISADGRYVVFTSSSTDLGVLDTNGARDVFRHDTWTGAVVRVSEGPFGEADGPSARPFVSGDGSRVAFESWATNLIAGDLNGYKDVFVADVGGLPVLASRTPAGAAASSESGRPAVSADGQYVAFNSWADDILPVTADLNVFRLHVDTLQLELVSQGPAGAGDDLSNAAAISADGRYVAFESASTNLAPLDGPGWDTFLRDMQSGQTWTVGRPSGAATAPDGDATSPDLAADASTVVFESRATNLAPGVASGQYEVYARAIHPDLRTYCEGSTTAAGCQPALAVTGHPSTASGGAFTVTADEAPNQRLALFLYGLAGPAALPFGGATLCVAGPRRRTPAGSTGGSAMGSDCSGSLALDLNAFAAGTAGGNPAAALTLVGQQVNLQCWGRDGAAAAGVFLTDALEYVVGP